jgi:phytanoyl-CoA hydroxylase
MHIGYLVIESFASEDEIQSMINRMEQLVDEFDPSSTASIFSTKNQVSYLLLLDTSAAR